MWDKPTLTIKLVLFIALIGSWNVQIHAQQTAPGTKSAAPSKIVSNSPLSLPRGFQNLLLGLPLDQVKTKLSKSPYFFYRGDPDVSLLPSGNQTVIETSGVTYVSKGIFQFHDGKLYTIIIMLNPDVLDYYSMFTSLTGKYGEPTSISPEEAVWENQQVRLSLEKPLTIKYIDRVVFDRIQKAGKATQSVRKLTRDEFINLF